MVTPIYLAILGKVAIPKLFQISTTEPMKVSIKKDFFWKCEKIARLLVKKNLVIAVNTYKGKFLSRYPWKDFAVSLDRESQIRSLILLFVHIRTAYEDVQAIA